MGVTQVKPPHFHLVRVAFSCPSYRIPVDTTKIECFNFIDYFINYNRDLPSCIAERKQFSKIKVEVKVTQMQHYTRQAARHRDFMRHTKHYLATRPPTQHPD